MLVLLLASLLLDGLKERPNTHKCPGAALQPVMSVDVALGTVLTKVADGDASSLTTKQAWVQSFL